MSVVSLSTRDALEQVLDDLRWERSGSEYWRALCRQRDQLEEQLEQEEALEQLSDTLGIDWHWSASAEYACDQCGGTDLQQLFYVWQDCKSEQWDLDGAEPTDMGEDFFCKDCEVTTTAEEIYRWGPP